MKNHDLIVRTYQDAAFIMNRENWNSIFFEGTLANEVPRILENRDIELPKNRKQKRDFLLLQKSIKDFLGEDKYQVKNTPGAKSEINYSIINLCKYARQNWQVINASIELLSKCNQNCLHCYWEELTKKGLELKHLLSLAKELKE